MPNHGFMVHQAVSCKVDSDQLFFFKCSVDEGNLIEKLVWEDSRSQMDYATSGDVLVFDTTYQTNSYNKSFVILASMSSHYLMTIFGCSLLADESFETYKWALETFMEAMHNKRPVSIVTMGNACEELKK